MAYERKYQTEEMDVVEGVPRVAVSPKQKAFVKNVIKHLGKGRQIGGKGKGTTSWEHVALESGYSKRMARTQHTKIRESRGVKEALNKIMGDDDIAQLHTDLLAAGDLDNKEFDIDVDNETIKAFFRAARARLLTIRKVEEPKEEDKKPHKIAYYIKPDRKIRREALDLFYKIKGEYAPEVHGFIGDFDQMTDEELKEYIAEKKKELEKPTDVEAEEDEPPVT